MAGEPARTIEGTVVSSPQVSAILMLRRGLKPSWRKRIMVSTQIAACAFMSDGAAAIEIATFLDQGEGIAGPVLALGFHHIEMGQQQDRLGLRVAAGCRTATSPPSLGCPVT